MAVVGCARHNGAVTTKERLRLLVESMTDEQAERAIRVLEPLATPEQATGPQGNELPDFVGAFASGDGRLSSRVDELLADGFGR